MYNQFQPRERSSEQGSTLVMCMLVVSAIAVMSLSLVTTTMQSNEERKQAHENLNAIYVAEAGVQMAAMELASGRTGNLGSENNPVTYGTGSLQVDVQALAGGLFQVTSQGIENGSSTTVQVLMSSSADSAYRWAAFGDESMTLDSNALVDSYDSSLGAYTDQDNFGSGSNRYALDNGNVGSNNDIVLYSNADIFGDAVPGPGFSATTNGNSTVSGTSTSASTTYDLEPLDFPTIASSGDLSTGGDYAIGAGDYYYPEFIIDGNSTLTITGPATIVADSMNVESNASIMIDATNGPVEFWVYNDFTMNSNTLIAATDYNPANVKLLLNADNILDPNAEVDVDGDIAFDSNAKFYGTISAPNSSIEINSNFELFGSVEAKRVHLDSNSKIHFDENLLTSGASAAASYRTVGWRIIGE